MQALVANFIPAALNVDDDRFDGAEGQRFLRAIGKLPSWKSSAEVGPRDRPQGHYICDASGALVAWMSSAGIADNGEKGGSSMNAARHQAMMKRALAGKPPATKPSAAVAGDEVVLTAEKNFLASFHANAGAIFRFTCRDLPRPNLAAGEKSHWSKEYYRREWNLNYGGFSQADLRRFLPAALTPATKHEVPAELVQRLAHDYFIDNAHGSPPSYYRVKKARMTSEVVKVDDHLVTVRMHGETQTADGAHGCGYDAKVLGRARYDSKERKVVFFELVVVGMRTGAVTHSGRGPWGGMPEDVGPAPMGIVAVLVGAR